MGSPATGSSGYKEPVISTDVLVVGSGPAGGSLASFLSSYHVRGLLISRDTSTAFQPRAHVVNPATFECLRDIGLEKAFRDVGLKNSYYGDYRYSRTLAGKDLIKFHSFGKNPSRLGDYATVSPCEHEDISQNLAEPILLKYATQNGFSARFQSKFVDYTQDPTTGLITSLIEDQLSKQTFRVVSKYLCGADGTSSTVARKAGLPFNTIRGGNNALSIWYEADLTNIYRLNPGLLQIAATPDKEAPSWALFGINRVVRPYTEFHISYLATPGTTYDDVTQEQAVARLRELIGDDSIKIKVKDISKWRVNDSYAETFSNGNVFCLGDSVDKHSPGNGLGLNTAIQDSYNFAWKLAHVLQGKGGPNLLSSYSSERQPNAVRTVRIANGTVDRHFALCGLLGLLLPSTEERTAALALLEEDSEAGRQQRGALRDAYEAIKDETSGLGGEMNQRYISSAGAAVYADDEISPAPEIPGGSAGIQNHVISTYPGSRLPHAWLEAEDADPGERISTHDVAGHGRWVLLTGIGGKQAWSEAAAQARSDLELDVQVYSIGRGQDYVDTYYMWEDRRGVEEDGAVLVRPDRFVAWRSGNKEGHKRLTDVLRKVLAL